MAKKKTVSDFDARIAAAKAELSALYKGRREAMQEAKGVVGETVIMAMPGIPFERNACKQYFENVNALIAKHQDEFDAMFGGKAPVREAPAAVEADETDDTVGEGEDDGLA